MEENKIRVVIAEDEPPIGRFLRKLVEQTPGFEVVAVCLNGETAAEAVKELQAELIISDIRMPGISGLELIARIKNEVGDIHSVIITGYKMFEYAREAISLKIDAFITKPVNPKELRKTLETIREKHLSACTSHLRMTLETILRFDREEEFQKVIPYRNIRLLFLYYSGQNKEISEVLHAMDEGMLFVPYREALVVFEDADSAPGKFQVITRKIMCMKPRRRTCILVEVEQVPAQDNFITRMRQFYRNTVRKLAAPGRTAHFAYPAFWELQEDYGGDEGLMRQTEIAVMAKDYGSLKETLFQLFDCWKKAGVSIYHMRRRIHNISAMMERAGMLEWDKVSLNDRLDELLVCKDSYDEVREAVLECWMNSLQSCTGQMGGAAAGSRDYHVFEQIKVFIEQNRSQNYSLQEISGIFKASQPYIRKVFRQYTGKSYNEYVVDRKIAYAVELMEANPHIFVKDVADILGFDQLYFSTVFKKAMGASPSQYKAMLAEKEYTND